jgi:Rrf2 family protein
MKLTHASGYALAALAHMAAQAPGQPFSSRHIAEARGIPERFLLKVLKPLVDRGVLRSVKGPNGGYLLARAPKDVTLLEVVEAVDGPVRGDVPDVGQHAAAAMDKKLRGACDRAAELARERLGRVALAELARGN